MKKFLNKVQNLKYLASVSMITAFAALSVCGYTKPVFDVTEVKEYNIKNLLQDENESQKNTHLKPVFTTADQSLKNSIASTVISPSTEPAVFGNAAYKDGTYYGKGMGFGGEITVKVVISDGSIKSISIVNSSDGKAFIKKAESLIDVIIKTGSTNVDAVSGATYSSNGIISAVRDALSKAAANSYSDNTELSQYTKNTKATHIYESTVKRIVRNNSNLKYKDGVYYGEGTGFNGKLTVKVVIKNGKIYSVKIIKTNDGKEFIEKAKTLTNIIVSKQSTDVDAVSGATYSSNGIIFAVENALMKAVVNKSEKTTVHNKSVPQTSYATKPTEPIVTAVKRINEEIKTDVVFQDGEYFGVGEGYKGEIKLKVIIKNGKINSVQTVSSNDDSAFYGKASALFKTIVKKQSTAVDTVSGATYSSEGIIEAVSDALEKAAIVPSFTSYSVSSETSETLLTESTQPPTIIGPTLPSATINTEPFVPQLKYNSGIYFTEVTCTPDENWDFEPYYLSAEVKIENDRIIDISTLNGYGDDFDEQNSWYISRAADGTKKVKGVIAQILENGNTDNIDAVSGATCSSKAIAELAEKALSTAERS